MVYSRKNWLKSIGLATVIMVSLGVQALALLKPGAEFRALPNYDIRKDEKVILAEKIPASKYWVNKQGRLTEPRLGDAETIARDFLSNHLSSFAKSEQELTAMQTKRNYRTEHNGITHLTFQQMYQGLEVFKSEIRVNVAKDGAIISIGANNHPGLTGSITPKLSVTDAVLAGAKSINSKSVFLPEIKSISTELNQKTIFDAGPFAEEIVTDLVIFPLGSSGKPAWRMFLAEKDTPNVYIIVVDAEDSTLLYRQNLTNYASGRVYEESPEATYPPFSNTRVMKVFDGTAVSSNTATSPSGWVTSTTSEGNNVRAEEDWDANNSTPGKVASEPTGVFDFPIDLYQDPTTYRDASITNLFWVNNLMHDWLYDLGFNEASGNFQTNNFGRGGLGNDAVTAQTQDGSGTNNANFSTPADGSKPRMQMYIFTSSTPRRDSSLENDIPIHEYCHGLSNRLVGVNSLDGVQSGGMGEGWGDWYAITLLDDSATNMNNSMVVGAYVVNDPTGIRRYPYSTNTAVYPLTYGDIYGEVHDDGEIWCVTLWEIYKLFVQRYGLDSDTTQPWRVELPYDGRERVWLIVTDAMKLAPDSPTFLDMRDAILLADENDFAGADKDIIWQVFAKRGMGYSAISNGDTISVTEAFDLPPNTPYLQYAGLTINDNQGNNDGNADAGETIIMPVSLKNRGIYDATNITATLTCASPYITITRSSGTYPNIAVGTTQTVNSPYFEWYSSATTPLINAAFILQIQSKYSTGLSYNTTANFSVPIGRYVLETVAYNWVNATTSGTKVILGDDASTTVNLGFNFNFYGNMYNSVLISSNGYLSFGTTGKAYSNTTIPNMSEPNNMICVLWDDLDPSKAATGGVYYLTSGSAPNRQFTVAWVNVPPYNVIGPGTFEVTLYETSGDITGQYQDVIFGNLAKDSGASATVGIENMDGKMGLQYSYNSALLYNGLALRYAIMKGSIKKELNSYGAFTVGSDTTHWYFEKYGDGTGAGTLFWSSNFAGQSGVVKLTQTPGQKAKLTQIFSVKSAGWYTAIAKVATDIPTVSKQQKVYLYLQELDSATTIVATGNQVLQSGNGAFGSASTWRDLTISFYTQATLLGVQLVAINNTLSNVTGSLYGDEIWVYAGVAQATTAVALTNAGFDAGTTGWLVQVYGNGSGAGSWSGWSGLLLGTQAGGEKAQLSQLFSFTGSGIDAIASVKVLSGATTLNNSQKVYLYIYSYDSGYTKIIESSNAILQPGKWTPGVWRELKFGFSPFTAKNSVQVVAINPSGKPYQAIYFDALEVDQE